MKRKTKIVATLGPAVATQERIEALIEAGMNVARLNCSHGEWSEKRDFIRWIRESQGDRRIGILADLQGPKIRLGKVRGGQLDVVTGSICRLSQDEATDMQIPDREIYHDLVVGDRVLLGDGAVELKVLSRQDHWIEATVLSGGPVKNRQGITVVGRSFDFPPLTERDRADVVEACAAGVDFIALSYVRTGDHMRELRDLIAHHAHQPKICAKVETREAVKNLDDIIRASDLVMVARGDLGLQIDLEEVPLVQKMIIRKCTTGAKPVITATQMLESMMGSPRPTRAEATDVANAILDGTDAVMLSGETAAGLYPIEAVRTMARIAVEAEKGFNHDAFLGKLMVEAGERATEAVGQAAVALSKALKAKALVCTSTSGLTPRVLSKFRPECPCFCATWNEETRGMMSVIWGVDSVPVHLQALTEDTISETLAQLRERKLLKSGDKVVITAGVPIGTPGHTNLILFETI